MISLCLATGINRLRQALGMQCITLRGTLGWKEKIQINTRQDLWIKEKGQKGIESHFVINGTNEEKARGRAMNNQRVKRWKAKQKEKK